jgi:hypothetical protein
VFIWYVCEYNPLAARKSEGRKGNGKDEKVR